MEQHGDDTGERTGADERDEKKTIGKELQPRGGFFEHEDCNARKIRCCSGDDRRWRGARRRSLTQFDGIESSLEDINAIAGGIDAIARGIDAVAAQRSEVQRVLLAIRDEDAGYRYADKKWTWIAAGHVRQHLDVLHERYGSHADFSRVGICARRDSPVAR